MTAKELQVPSNLDLDICKSLRMIVNLANVCAGRIGVTLQGVWAGLQGGDTQGGGGHRPRVHHEHIIHACYFQVHILKDWSATEVGLHRALASYIRRRSLANKDARSLSLIGISRHESKKKSGLLRHAVLDGQVT